MFIMNSFFILFYAFLFILLNHLEDDLMNSCSFCGLKNYFIHFVTPSFLHVRVFCVPSVGHNHWLHDFPGAKIASDKVCGFKPVHDWHAAVHEDEAVRVVALVVCFFNKVECSKTVYGLITNVLNAANTRLFNHNFHPPEIVCFIIHNHYSSVFVHFCQSLIISIVIEDFVDPI